MGLLPDHVLQPYLGAGPGSSNRVQLAFLAGPDGSEGRQVGVSLSHLSEFLLLHLRGKRGVRTQIQDQLGPRGTKTNVPLWPSASDEPVQDLLVWLDSDGQTHVINSW